MLKHQKIAGTTLTGYMAVYGLKRRWYEFDWLARRRLIKYLKGMGML